MKLKRETTRRRTAKMEQGEREQLKKVKNERRTTEQSEERETTEKNGARTE